MPAGKTIRELIVKATLKYDRKSFSKFNSAVTTAAASAKSMAFAVGGASAAVGGFAKIASAHGRNLVLYSKQTGINTQRLQELGFAAQKVAHITQDELMGSLQGMTMTLQRAREGQLDAAHGFRHLGLSQEVLTNRSLKADQMLALIADRWKDLPNDMIKAKVAQDVFGSAGLRLIPLLEKGSDGMAELGNEARRLGLVMDDAALKRGKKFEEKLAVISMIAKDLTYRIGVQLFGALEPVLKSFQRWVIVNRQFIQTGIVTTVKALGKFLKIALGIMTHVAKRAKTMIDWFGGLEKVVNTLAIVLGVVFGAKMLAMLGAMTVAVGALVASFLSMPVLVGAAVIALILIIEDLWAFFKGEDSLFGRITGMKPDAIIGFFRGIGEGIDFYVIQPIKTMMGWLQKAMEFGAKLSGIGGGGFLGGLVTKGMNLLGGGPETSPVGAQTTNNQSSTKINAPITVTVPPGTPAGEATRVVSDGVSDGLSRAARAMRNMTVGGAAY